MWWRSRSPQRRGKHWAVVQQPSDSARERRIAIAATVVAVVGVGAAYVGIPLVLEQLREARKANRIAERALAEQLLADGRALLTEQEEADKYASRNAIRVVFHVSRPDRGTITVDKDTLITVNNRSQKPVQDLQLLLGLKPSRNADSTTTDTALVSSSRGPAECSTVTYRIVFPGEAEADPRLADQDLVLQGPALFFRMDGTSWRVDEANHLLSEEQAQRDDVMFPGMEFIEAVPAGQLVEVNSALLGDCSEAG